MMNRSSFLILISCLLISPLSLLGNPIDEDALNFEKNKKLVPFNMQKYWDATDVRFEEEDQIDVKDYSECPFQDHNWPFDESFKQRHKIYKEKEEARISATEKEIESGIDEYLRKNPNLNSNSFIISNIIIRIEEKDNWAKKAFDIAEHLNKKGIYEHANSFYDLAYLSDHFYEKFHTQSRKGSMYLSQYNAEIQFRRPRYPTSSLFHNMNSALQAHKKAQIEGIDAIYETIPDMTKIRDMMVRWHISAHNVSQDAQLAEVIYARGFVDKILSEDWPRLQVLVPTLDYDGTKKDTDLAYLLESLGYHCYKQGDTQDNWVNKNGRQIRVKHQKPEFTIGYQFNNPFEWDSVGKPIGRKLYESGEPVIEDHDNEVVKLVIGKESVFLVPAFNNYSQSYWKHIGTLWYTDHTKAHEDHNLKLMGDAHRKLAQPSKKRSRDFMSIDRNELNRVPVSPKRQK